MLGNVPPPLLLRLLHLRDPMGVQMWAGLLRQTVASSVSTTRATYINKPGYKDKGFMCNAIIHLYSTL